MSGGFAQRLTVIICPSNYLLHYLFFVCYISHLLRALLLTPPSAHISNQLIITHHQMLIEFGVWHTQEMYRMGKLISELHQASE